MKAKEKNSSIELLRIICMILIIAHHYVVHTKGFPNSYSFLTPEILYLKSISMFGKASCAIFVLITGYYMVNNIIDWKKLKKKVISLVAFCTSYAMVFYIIFVLVGKVKLSFVGIRNALLPLLCDEWWFVRYYTILLLLTPFINMVLINIDQKTFRRIILCILVIWSILPRTFNFTLEFSEIDFFVVMYIIGAYERLYPNKKENNLVNLLVSVIMMFVIIFSVPIYYIISIKIKDYLFISNMASLSQFDNIFCVIWAIYLFKFFKNISFSNKIINCIAGTVLGIYVIHDNSHVRKWIWNEVYPNKNYVSNPYLHSVVKIVAVFSICMVIELVRKYIICRPIKLMIESYKIKRNKLTE